MRIGIADGGRVLVRLGLSELGQGMAEAAALSAEQLLGCAREDVDVLLADTATTPDFGSHRRQPRQRHVLENRQGCQTSIQLPRCWMPPQRFAANRRTGFASAPAGSGRLGRMKRRCRFARWPVPASISSSRRRR